MTKEKELEKAAMDELAAQAASKEQAEIAEKARKYDEAQAKAKRYWVKQTLLIKKAVAAKIEVTDEEIDKWIADHKKQ